MGLYQSLSHKQKTSRMWGYNHYQSNILNKSANAISYMNALYRLEPFVTYINIAIHSNNKPIKLQRFNIPNFSNYITIP